MTGLETRLMAAVAAFFMSTGVVAACPTWTNLQNNSVADANQVMGNFNSILQCPNFTGNVGIGTATPGSALDVYNALITLGTPTSGARINGRGPMGGAGIWLEFSDGNAYYDSAAGTSFRVNANSGTVTALYLAPSGSVGVGTTSPTSTLYVNGSAGGTQSWNGSSDVRLKKNIRRIENALTMVEQIQGVRFDWRSPAERTVGKTLNLPISQPQIGFIAQDLEKVVPEAVSTSADSEKLKSIAESKVVPVLVEAIKELKSENDRETAENDRLKVNDGAMRSELNRLERQFAALQAELPGLRRKQRPRMAALISPRSH